jgi:hypothetical protein
MEFSVMRFTTANAREMAARSVAARKAAAAERLERLAQTSLSPAPDSPPATPTTDANPGVSVACVRARLETLDGLMARAGKDSKEWDNLTRAYDRLFRVLCVLTNTPGPGQRKPAERKGLGLGSLLGINLPIPPLSPVDTNGV